MACWRFMTSVTIKIRTPWQPCSDNCVLICYNALPAHENASNAQMHFPPNRAKHFPFFDHALNFCTLNSIDQNKWVGLAMDSQLAVYKTYRRPSCVNRACYIYFLEASFLFASTNTHYWAWLGASQTHFISGVGALRLQVCYFYSMTHAQTSTGPSIDFIWK